MSMMKTLAKVAIGVAVAKGVSGMMKKGGGGQTASRSQTGGGGLFGGMHSPGAQAQQGGGIEDMLGSILGGGGTGDAQSGGGLGGLLEQLGGGSRGASSGGGLNDLLGGLAGAGKGAGGGLGDMLGGLLGAAAGKAPTQSGGGFGDLLNQAIARQDEPEQAPSADQEAMAALMLRAMIAAMKSDGEIDAQEEQKLLGRLGDVSPEEQAFVQNELRQPLSADAIARDVPRGLEAQVYAMSVMGIDLDSQSEAKYLHQLATAMGIGPKDVNHIHEQMGVPAIYA